MFEPDAEGSWPVVLAFHGINGSADHMAEIGKRLAGAGFVVVRYVLLEGVDHFAPVFHRDRDGDMVLAPDDPAGERIVELVVDAIGDQ